MALGTSVTEYRLVDSTLETYTPLGGGYILEATFTAGYPLLLAGSVPTTSEL